MKKLFLGFLFLLVLTLLPLSKANAAGAICDSIDLLAGSPPAQNSCPVCPPNSHWLNGGLNGAGCYYMDGSSRYTQYCVAILDCSRIPGTQCAIGQNGFGATLAGCCDPNDKNNPAKCHTSYPTPTPANPTPTPAPGSPPTPTPYAGDSQRCQVCPTGSNWNGSVCIDRSGNPVQLQTATCPVHTCDVNHSNAGCTLGDPQCGQFVLNTDTCPTSCPKTEISPGTFKCLDPLNKGCDPYAQPSNCSVGQVCFLTDPGTSTWSCCDPSNKDPRNPCGNQEWVGKDVCTKDGTSYKCSTGLGISLSTSPGGFVGQIFGIVLGIAGTIALILIIISGYKLMTSQGDAEKVKDAREQLTAAIIGLLFVIFSFFLLTFIGGTILGIYK